MLPGSDSLDASDPGAERGTEPTELVWMPRRSDAHPASSAASPREASNPRRLARRDP